MAKSFTDVYDTFQRLDRDYMDRHADHRKLRDYFHGRYWQETEEQSRGLASLFKDLRNASEVGPDLKLVHNLLMEVVTKFQTYLSPLPMINVPTDPPMSVRNRDRATLKERYLYGLWSMGNMNQIAAGAAWYLPLMGDGFLGAIPDPTTNLVTPVLRSPEYAYPIPNMTPGGWDAIIFRWEITEDAARHSFPNLKLEKKKGRNRKHLVEVVEYHDTNEWARWVDGHKTHGVEHRYGFNLFQQMKFIPVPDEIWGHSAVEQIVGMVEMGNALKSLTFQAVLENVFPRLILINPQKFPEEIDNGPGAVIGVNEGGDAKWLHPPTQLLQSQVAFGVQNDQNIKEATFMPDASFGQFDASIITGKAINELQGAGTGSVVQMVQGVCMGPPLVGWNERAIYIGQHTFKDEDIHLHGHITPGMTEINPRYFAMNITGSKLQGSTRNEVVFQPHIGQHEKLVMGLQALSGGLVSKRHVREQMGIPDTTAMEEEIYAEQIEAGVLAAALAAMETAATSPEQVEQQGFEYIEGRGPAPVVPPGGAAPFPVPIPGGAAPQGMPPGMPPAGMPPTAAPPPTQEAEPGAAELSTTVVTLDQAVAALQTVANVNGRVFLVGEIVAQGQTRDDIEVAVTDMSDKQTIAAALPEFAGMLVFLDVEGEPREQFVEVTPGQDVAPGGVEPTLEELMAGA